MESQAHNELSVLQKYLLRSSRVFLGIFLALSMAFIGEGLVGYGKFSFYFVLITFFTLFWRASRFWNLLRLFIFLLILLGIWFSLKMYILVAPGA